MHPLYFLSAGLVSGRIYNPSGTDMVSSFPNLNVMFGQGSDAPPAARLQSAIKHALGLLACKEKEVQGYKRSHEMIEQGVGAALTGAAEQMVQMAEHLRRGRLYAERAGEVGKDGVSGNGLELVDAAALEVPAVTQITARRICGPTLRACLAGKAEAPDADAVPGTTQLFRMSVKVRGWRGFLALLKQILTSRQQH